MQSSGRLRLAASLLLFGLMSSWLGCQTSCDTDPPGPGPVVPEPKPPLEPESFFVRQVAGNRRVIVFVHGVLGDARSTWTSTRTGAYFPALVSEVTTFDGCDVFVYEYPSPALEGSLSIDELSESVRLVLDSYGVTRYDEMVFVAHSMGGLVVRSYLNKYAEVAKRVKFICYYSTPSAGADVATVARLASSNPQFAQMKPMRSEDYLADLQRAWLASPNKQIPAYCAYERRPTYGVNIVTQASATLLANRRLDPLDEDHITIVKPAGATSPSFLVLRSAYLEVFPSVTPIDFVISSSNTSPDAPSAKYTGKCYVYDDKIVITIDSAEFFNPDRGPQTYQGRRNYPRVRAVLAKPGQGSYSYAAVSDYAPVGVSLAVGESDRREGLTLTIPRKKSIDLDECMLGLETEVVLPDLREDEPGYDPALSDVGLLTP
jgi:pimeloyl-ACP methyl ester carboxylesterase